jgi:L-2-hydroxyglutarate oxidase
MRKNVIVIGGGLVGLSTSFHILKQYPGTSLTLIEKEKNVGLHQSSHNSGVIHSGIYYSPGSLKAINCVDGYHAMLSFCEKYGIEFEITGKVVVATSPTEIPRLEKLHDRGVANGLKGLRLLNPSEIQDYEPNCVGLKGIHVPQTGIINYLDVAIKLAELVRELGGEILLNERVTGIRNLGKRIEVKSLSKIWMSDAAVVCAGLQSDRLAQFSQNDTSFRILPFRGEYYEFTKSAPKLVNNLIYPVPNPAFPFLGVHFTKTINGAIECGPNAVFSLGRETYKKSNLPGRDLLDSITWPGTYKLAYRNWQMGLGEFYRSQSKQAFVRALQHLVPAVQPEHLQRGESGIRAQATDSKGNLIDDFKILQDGNLINVCNAPSPAATASLAIGKTISRTLMSSIV